MLLAGTNVQEARGRLRCPILCGLTIALLGCCGIVPAQAVSEMQRIQTNSNRTAGGILVDGVLTIDLEIREGEWFPEDEHGPSIKVFALAEKGKPAQIPGPMIRIPQGTEIHVIVHNLITKDVSIHGMHTRPGKNDDTFDVPGGSTRDVTFSSGAPGAKRHKPDAGR